MRITFDSVKRARALAERGLDFADTPKVFDGWTITNPDLRHDYGEDRFVTLGELDGRFVVLVWTPRDDGRRIISMRHAHDDEVRYWRDQLDRFR